ncbi:hypothetical protein KP509_25G063200 [Ceratopteris richardii]|nr:hypothetical protein KP509_25G063200 [Ceratopteris richardii]
MDWSMQAFSQLVASSQREGFGLSQNPDATTYIAEVADEEYSSPSEKVQIFISQSPYHNSPECQGAHPCVICSRLLKHRSPWSAQRMLLNNRDLPVLGILACGHVFHADCLERGVPASLKHDPPCPECNHHKVAFDKGTNDGLINMNSGHSSLKDKFSRIGPHLWRSLSNSKFSFSRHTQLEKARRNAGEKGFFQRSFSRKQLSFLVRPVKDSGNSRRVSSPAQVSPENQT